MPESKIGKAMDVISAALVAQYHKNVMVIQEGHASDAAIDAIPTSVSVFIICAENHHGAKFEPEVVHTGKTIDDISSQVIQGVATIHADDWNEFVSDKDE